MYVGLFINTNKTPVYAAEERYCTPNYFYTERAIDEAGNNTYNTFKLTSKTASGTTIQTNLDGYCVEPTAPTVPGSGTTSNTSNTIRITASETNSTYRSLRKLLWVVANDSQFAVPDSTGGNRLAGLVQSVGTYYLGNPWDSSGNPINLDAPRFSRGDVKNLYNRAEAVSWDDIPVSFVAYFITWGNSVQDVITYSWEYFGELQFKKISSDTSSTSTYPLTGAKIKLYTDSSMTIPAYDTAGNLAEFTIGSNGLSEIRQIGVSSGDSQTYYWKEIVTPNGYIEGATGTVTVYWRNGTVQQCDWNNAAFTITNTPKPQTIWVRIHKNVFLNNSRTTQFNPSGATYNILKNNSGDLLDTNLFANNTRQQFVIQSDGYSQAVELKIPTSGIYGIRVQEVSGPTNTPAGYQWNNNMNIIYTSWNLSPNVSVPSGNSQTNPLTIGAGISNSKTNNTIYNDIEKHTVFVQIEKTSTPNGLSTAGAIFDLVDSSGNNLPASWFSSGSYTPFTIQSNGKSNIIELNLPTSNARQIRVKERSVPSSNYSWVLNTNVIPLYPTLTSTTVGTSSNPLMLYTNNAQTTKLNNNVQTYWIRMKKEIVPTSGGGNTFSPYGAEFDIVRSSNGQKLEPSWFARGVYEKFVIGADGWSQPVQLLIPKNGAIGIGVTEIKLPTTVYTGWTWDDSMLNVVQSTSFVLRNTLTQNSQSSPNNITANFSNQAVKNYIEEDYVPEFVYLRVKKETIPSTYSAQGAVYRLYTDSSCTTTIPTSFYADDEPDREFVIGASGYSQYIKLKANNQTIYIKEFSGPTTTPTGYTWSLDTTAYPQTLSTGLNSTAESPITINSTDELTIEPPKVQVLKSVPSGYIPTGAEYTLYTDSNCTTEAPASYFESGVKEKFIIQSNGYSNIINLTPPTSGSRTLYIKETKAPIQTGTYFSWNMDSVVKQISYSAGSYTSTPLTINSTNTVSNWGRLRIHKTESDGNDSEVIGAQFTVYEEDGITVAKTKDNQQAILTIGNDNYSETIYLKPGKYIIKETITPTNYLTMDPQNITVVAGSDNNNYTKEFENEINPLSNSTEINIVKRINSMQGVLEPNIRFQLYNGSTMYSSGVTDGINPLKFTSLIPGTYTIKQATAAIDTLSISDISFVINSDLTITITQNPNSSDVCVFDSTTNTFTLVNKFRPVPLKVTKNTINNEFGEFEFKIKATKDIMGREKIQYEGTTHMLSATDLGLGITATQWTELTDIIFGNSVSTILRINGVDYTAALNGSNFLLTGMGTFNNSTLVIPNNFDSEIFITNVSDPSFVDLPVKKVLQYQSPVLVSTENVDLSTQFGEPDSEGYYHFKLITNETKTILNLPYGSNYEIFELTQNGWEEVNKTNSSGILTIDETESVFTNRRTTTSVTVTKTVTGNMGNKNKNFEFEVKAESWETIWARLINDLTVNEFGPGYTDALWYSGGIGNLTSIFGSNSSTLTEKYKISCTNTPNQYINQSLNGITYSSGTINMGDKTLTDDSLHAVDGYWDTEELAIGDILKIQELKYINLSSYGGVPKIDENNDGVSDNGIYVFTLKDSESFELSDLPYGVTVTVSEVLAPGYKTTVNGSEGLSIELSLTENKEVLFENNSEMIVPTGLDNKYFMFGVLSVVLSILFILKYKIRKSKEI